MSLRDYQKYIYTEVQNAIRKGSHGVLVCLPCRSGKSYIFAEMIRNLKHGYALVLAHRRELLRQHEELLATIPHEKYRLASVFTEVNHVREHEPPTIVIIDEAHLSEAMSYKRVCEAYPNAIRIGFTATPQRLSGEPLSLFDTMVKGITVDELIRNGSVSEFDYYAPKMNVSVDDIGCVAGDFNNKELSERMCQSRLYGDYIEAYKRLGKDRQAIAYCVSQKHAKAVSEAFNEAGISSVEVDSKTPAKEREEIMSDYKAGKYRILCNVNLISEGITLPETDVCMLLRPTQSIALYIQQAARCLTPREGKRATIIDCVENVLRHGLPNEEHDWQIGGNVHHKVTNVDGSFSIRTCEQCFRVYDSRMKVCPYCGHEYEIKGRELQRVKEVEMELITKEKAKEMELVRKRMRQEVGRARSMDDLWRIARERGYAPGWVYRVSKAKGIRK